MSLPCATENISFSIGQRSDIVGIDLAMLSHIAFKTTILDDTMHRHRIKGLRDNLDVWYLFVSLLLFCFALH